MNLGGIDQDRATAMIHAVGNVVTLQRIHHLTEIAVGQIRIEHDEVWGARPHDDVQTERHTCGESDQHTGLAQQNGNRGLRACGECFSHRSNSVPSARSYGHIHNVLVCRYQAIAYLRCRLKGQVGLLDRDHHLREVDALFALLEGAREARGFLLIGIDEIDRTLQDLTEF